MRKCADVPEGFNDPTALPSGSEQARRWQELNRTCSESHPMRYDWKQAIPYKQFSKEFYLEIDHRLDLAGGAHEPRGGLGGTWWT
jgi:hypothetical protein